MEGERFGLMPNISYLRCRRCQELLKNPEEPYCAPCNIFLCYEAMPLLLWMLMMGKLALPARLPINQVPLYDTGVNGYDRADAVCWE